MWHSAVGLFWVEFCQQEERLDAGLQQNRQHKDRQYKDRQALMFCEQTAFVFPSTAVQEGDTICVKSPPC